MSESVVDAAVITRTQEILGKFVKKPALTEKLLNKPPFRFLHDIVNTIIKETGFLEGLYSKEELNSENVKDRDSKIKFLQKLIDVIKLSTDENVSARPSKIVAGHEPDKTNQLLQFVGIAIEKKFDWKQAIESNKNNNPGKQKTSTKSKPQSQAEIKTTIKDKTTTKDKTTAKDRTTTKDKSTSKPANRNDKKISSTNLQTVTNDKKHSSKIDSKSRSKTKEKEKPQVKEFAKESKIEEKAKDITIKSEKKVNENVAIIEIDTPQVPSSEVLQKNESISTFSENGQNEKPTERKDGLSDKITQLQDASSIKAVAALAAETQKFEKKASVDSNNSNSNDHPDSKPNERKKSSSNPRRKSSVEDSLGTLVVERSEGSGKSTRSNRKSIDNGKKLTDQNQDLSIPKAPETTAQTDVSRQSTFVKENSQNEIGGRPRTSLRPPSVRPASARPGAPRRRDKNVEIILQPNDQVKLAGINVKVESFESQLEDDGENLVIIENIATTTDGNNIDNTGNKILLDEESQKGHLVQQILQTQKELTQADSESPADGDLDIGTIQKRQSSARQMDSLRDVIQNLTRSINPLGKLMDFLPEDIDSMHLELTMWRDVYIQTSGELKKEKGLTESAIEPMKNQLAQINTSIKDYIDTIDTSRAKILNSTEKIYKLLTEQ